MTYRTALIVRKMIIADRNMSRARKRRTRKKWDNEENRLFNISLDEDPSNGVGSYNVCEKCLSIVQTDSQAFNFRCDKCK